MFPDVLVCRSEIGAVATIIIVAGFFTRSGGTPERAEFDGRLREADTALPGERKLSLISLMKNIFSPRGEINLPGSDKFFINPSSVKKN
jgi:hypothetical protein